MVTDTDDMTYPPLPSSWSMLTWRQLCTVWDVKRRYGANPDAARAAALLALVLGDGFEVRRAEAGAPAGETVYTLASADGSLHAVTPRELSYMAARALAWLDYPYGDPGEKEETDGKGNVLKEGREPVRGYVSEMRDALILPETEVTVGGVTFALPTVACANITWQQYRTLQNIAPRLFADGLGAGEAAGLQAEFVAHCLVPAMEEQPAAADRFRPPHVFRYDSDRAEQSVAFWSRQLESQPVMFDICFQAYQTAVAYYAQVFPLLFGGGGKSDPLRDALTNETETLNSVMKYQGYGSPEEVYAADLPNILTVLNTMAREAKQIEEMNRRTRIRK